ncbi:unnamed protein product [Wuchereria bancrofti]|uniref:Uncharacterized protein n=1 Tax=Wuchereria bancrofti TaxID=6293 RepID=A0A3P7EE40_WUCBA|nr:unnamed protein product [Wuchereria bancrofti]
MLPFVYSGDGDRCGSYDNERYMGVMIDIGEVIQEAVLDPDRGPEIGDVSDSRVRYSRSRSSGRSRSRSRSRTRSCSRSSHDRSPRLDFDRRRRSIDRDREPFRSQENFQAHCPIYLYASHTALYGQPHYKIVMKMLPTDSQRDAVRFSYQLSSHCYFNNCSTNNGY